MTFLEKCIHLRPKYLTNPQLALPKLHVLLQLISTAFYEDSGELPLNKCFTIDCSLVSYAKDTRLEKTTHDVLTDLGYSVFTTRIFDGHCVHITIRE